MRKTNILKSTAVLLTMAIVLGTANTPSSYVSAATPQDEIDEIEKKKKETQNAKAEAQNKLASLNQDKSDILEVIQELDNQIYDYEVKINGLTNDLTNLQTKISVTELTLANASAAESNQYANMKDRIQYAYENGDVAYINALMAVSDFSSINNQSEYVEQISAFDRAQLTQLLTIKQDIRRMEESLAADYAEVTEIRAEALDEQEALEIMQEGKKEKLAEYNALIADTENSITRYEQDEANFEAQIKEIERKAAEEEARRKAEEEERRKQQEAANNQSSGSYSESSSSSSSYSGGSFVWPMPAGSRISSYFGPRTSPTAGASSNHKGIDIPCPSGSSVLAAASGTVIYVGYMGSGGNAVLIDHGGGVVTLYYHLSGFNVSSGQSVSKGQTIAFSGNTGVSTGPHLHFGVRVNGSYQNPMNYF